MPVAVLPSNSHPACRLGSKLKLLLRHVRRSLVPDVERNGDAVRRHLRFTQEGQQVVDASSRHLNVSVPAAACWIIMQRPFDVVEVARIDLERP